MRRASVKASQCVEEEVHAPEDSLSICHCCACRAYTNWGMVRLIQQQTCLARISTCWEGWNGGVGRAVPFTNCHFCFVLFVKSLLCHLHCLHLTVSHMCRYVFKNLMRDWSQEGAPERTQSYGRICQEAQRQLAGHDLDDPPKILVPGMLHRPQMLC